MFHFFTTNSLLSRGLLIIMLFLLLSCTQNQASQNDGSKVAGDTSSVNPNRGRLIVDTINDDMAAVISGIEPLIECKGITTDKGWITYQQHIKADWKLVERSKTGPISRWREKNPDVVSTDTSTLFYPFAGADFLYAHAFFPDATSYVMIGLEPIGQLQRCDQMMKKDFLSYLEKIRASLYYSDVLGFFRTKSMETDLNQQSLDGTLPLILFYLRKMGHRLSGITYFYLDSKGKVMPCSQDTTTIGVKVSFFDSTYTKPQTLYYLSYDLSDKNLKKHPELLQFVKSFGRQVGFLKAASYLMFNSNFQMIRNYLLDQEASILQDDSGIPYRLFKSSGWTLKLFGTYTKTIDLFKNKFQPDLQSAIEKETTKHDVPFRIGYNVKFNETNLLFAKKKH